MKHHPVIRTLQPLTAALLGSFFAIPALAQGIPNAGRLLEEIKPPVTLPNTSIEALPIEETVRTPLSLPTDIRIKVSAIQITGTKAFSEQQLQPLVADLIGGEHSLAELEQAAQRITQYYRQQGYMLARAYLPAQAIKDGKVEISILEGRLDKIKLNNQSRIADTTIGNKLTSISSGRALKSDEVEKNSCCSAIRPA
ncbi:POTRA domain-containing protein [Herminiimonas arsenitoxidans]|uniref:POTRA domain-containing protein n=1 Tax=Herminiimonas arsenitoxidans TaxID=1809410 RepID=UPI0012FF75C4|nr:POTRA domain-containing protein [Herminiimonas arsenitoxidans]